MILVLLKMIDIQAGHVAIDGCDLASLEPEYVRQKINVIPQDSFFLPGTVRFNMDPHSRVSDEDIETVLRKVGLWERISSDGGLDMTLRATNWSAGERQLLALARALNVKSPILILDEATSRYVRIKQTSHDPTLFKYRETSILIFMHQHYSVDLETEAIMQRVIEEEFTYQTVIAVVHRFRYIDRFDRVALLNKGKLVECDDPASLLARDSGFRKLYTSL